MILEISEQNGYKQLYSCLEALACNKYTSLVNVLSNKSSSHILFMVKARSFPLSYLIINFGQGHYHMPETRGLCLSEELSTVRFPVMLVMTFVKNQ